MTELESLLEEDALWEQLELAEARESLAVYAGLHIPSDVEEDDLPRLSELPLPARYVPAQHHRLIIERLECLERGYVEENGERVPFKRLMILAPPGSAKSTYVTTLFPAWYLGRHPRNCVICASQVQQLADRFGRRARNLVAGPVHRRVFGSGLAADQRAAGQWETEQGGEYYATGAQPFAGRRADIALCDDLLRGREDADSKNVRDSIWEWILGDLRPRLKPGAALVYVTTRWDPDDPAGRILPKKWKGESGWVTAQDGEQWYVLCLVAVIETEEERDKDPLHRDVGEIIWPEWFTPEMLAQEKRSQGSRNWNALYQQKPRPDEGSIIKAHWWRKWPHKTPPECEYVISVYDTAFEEGEEDDYTARTTWGIFFHEDEPDDKRRRGPAVGRYCMILLGRLKRKLEFPELRQEAWDDYRVTKPDRVLIEKKVSGHSLLQELRRKGVPVMPVAADKSKLARAHAATPVFEQDCVFVMTEKDDKERARAWAQEVIDDCAAATFRRGDGGNDLGDTVVNACLYLRNTFHLNLRDEEAVEENAGQQKTKAVGYGAR